MENKFFRHFILNNKSKSELFTSPKPGRGSKMAIPEREPHRHAEKLLRELDECTKEFESINEIQKAQGKISPDGIILEFASKPNFDLDLEKFDKSGMKLLNVRQREFPVPGGKDFVTFATVRIPLEKIETFEKKVEAFKNEKTFAKPDKKATPKNQQLVAPIEKISLAKLKSFWTETKDFPPENVQISWEAWLRCEEPPEAQDAILERFSIEAKTLGVRVSDAPFRLPENIVVLIYGSAQQLSKSTILMDCLTELRIPSTPVSFFREMPSYEQKEWIDEAMQRISWPKQQANRICLLDSGVNRNHPLLEKALADHDLHSCNPSWGIADSINRPHGTEMAGLAFFGDLAEVLASSASVRIPYRLESVKILPDFGKNPEKLYGSITKESVARVESQEPFAKRLFAMAVTSTESTDKGRPTLWSSAIDAISSGAMEEDKPRRLFFYQLW
ncbi:MAG: S8 family peptidase [Candidatus Riflebacteria bacterium]|nr:S8 family peptidase [Candidatus Riflebacteria bacterium]